MPRSCPNDLTFHIGRGEVNNDFLHLVQNLNKYRLPCLAFAPPEISRLAPALFMHTEWKTEEPGCSCKGGFAQSNERNALRGVHAIAESGKYLFKYCAVENL